MLAIPEQKCPCCGQTVLDRRPLVDRTSNTFSWQGHLIEFSPKQAQLLDILARRMPRVATYDELISQLYGVDEPAESYKCVQTFICYCRRKLRPVGLDIEPVWKSGYRLVTA